MDDLLLFQKLLVELLDLKLDVVGEPGLWLAHSAGTDVGDDIVLLSDQNVAAVNLINLSLVRIVGLSQKLDLVLEKLVLARGLIGLKLHVEVLVADGIDLILQVEDLLEDRFFLTVSLFHSLFGKTLSFTELENFHFLIFQQ